MKAFKVAIEGCDGAGKATITEMLREYFVDNGKKVETISFPRYRKTSSGELLWQFLKSPEASQFDFLNFNAKAAPMLYAMDRKESLPYLQELEQNNDILILDRYVESNLIHQGSKLSNEDQESFAKWIENLEYVEHGLPRPDIIFYLSLPFEVSMQRAKLRAEQAGQKPDVGENDVTYMRNSASMGKKCALLLDWNIVDCMRGEREATREEIFESILYTLRKGGIK